MDDPLYKNKQNNESTRETQKRSCWPGARAAAPRAPMLRSPPAPLPHPLSRRPASQCVSQQPDPVTMHHPCTAVAAYRRASGVRHTRQYVPASRKPAAPLDHTSDPASCSSTCPTSPAKRTALASPPRNHTRPLSPPSGRLQVSHARRAGESAVQVSRGHPRDEGEITALASAGVAAAHLPPV